jgi:hypothetical protein
VSYRSPRQIFEKRKNLTVSFSVLLKCAKTVPHEKEKCSSEPRAQEESGRISISLTSVHPWLKLHHMKTRVGKIARLSYQTREQLNLRLLNGELSSTVLDWLNELPATKDFLNSVFAGKPISKQNLSEWRHGGYQDWLRHQHRQECFRHLSEQGAELENDEGPGDLFENLSRVVLAEMAEDINNLHEVPNRDQRWQRLREIGRELALLQHGYNHSRKTELSWDKWKSSFEYRMSHPQRQKPTPNPPANIGESAAVKPGQSRSSQNNFPSPPSAIHHLPCTIRENAKSPVGAPASARLPAPDALKIETSNPKC